MNNIESKTNYIESELKALSARKVKRFYDFFSIEKASQLKVCDLETAIAWIKKLKVKA